MVVDFAAVFDASPNAYMLVDRDLRYVAVNKAYCEATHRRAELLVGTSVMAEFPHDPEAPGNNQARRLADSLRGVFATGTPDVLPLIHYRIEVDGVWQDMYWSATHTPLFSTDGTVEYVLQHTVNVTEIQRNRSTNLQIEAGILDRAQAGEVRTAELDRSLRDLLSVFDQAPGFLAVTRGPEHVFELANPGYRKLVGGRDVVGRTVRDLLPEVEPHFFELLDRVYATGEPFVGNGVPVTLANAAGEPTEVFVDFIYQPLSGPDASSRGLLISGYDVTARVHAERAREHAQAERATLLEAERAARAQAERASLLMDQFLATVSHELRTPLTAILGWTQMLRSGTLAPEKHARALATVERNAQMQAQLVEDLLDVSRIITGKLTMEMEPTDLAGTVAAAIDTVRPSAQEKKVALDIEIDAGGTTVNGDGARLQQVVWNLMSNAVKFTPSEGRVSLRVSRDRDAVEIRVSDTGIGIAPEFLPHVFDRFRQADAGSTRRRGGLGLGLSIVHHVVEAHGGTVRAESKGVNQGSTFIVRIPSASTRTLRAVPTTIAAPGSLHGMKILVVDDEADTREFVRNLLEQHAATVTAVASAADAITALQHDKPDVLLSDLGMPDEDGYGLIRQVRALSRECGGRVPAVALTAYARTEDRTRAILAGFQTHVAKPVVPGELLAVLASFRN
ncbi:MAG TPA: ATP-binding protein [Kofleriaceae bacterium]|nr:ATP-binding protein [Kofleriaceae bacterium]